MKYLAKSPLEAALRAGGCTLEPEIGWWTYSTEELSELGEKFNGGRDALYIPTLQKTGEPVATEGMIDAVEAVLIGPARGA